MSPEDNIRMMLGLDGTPVPVRLGPGDYTMPRRPPSPQVPIITLYPTDPRYVGDGTPVSPMFQPGDWEEQWTLDKPRAASPREVRAAALAKRRKLGLDRRY